MVIMVDITSSLDEISEGLRLVSGEKVRVYLDHGGHNEIQIREGVITNPNCSKKGFLANRFPAFKMQVERSGIDVNGTPELRVVGYTQIYFYKSLKRVERL